jgi:hypothetical protein
MIEPTGQLLTARVTGRLRAREPGFAHFTQGCHVVLAIGLALLTFAGSRSYGQDASNDAIFDAFMGEAITALGEARYEDAYALAEQSVALRPDDRRAQKVLIIAAYETDRTEQALEFASSFLDHSFDCDVGLIAAEANDTLGNAEASRSARIELVSFGCGENGRGAPAQPLPGVAGRDIDAAHPRKEGFSGFVSAGLEYNTNVASRPDESGEPSDIGDMGFTTTFELNHETRLDSNWSAGPRLLGFGNFYFDDARDFNVQFLRADVHASYAAENWSLSVAALHDEVIFDKDRTIASNGVTGTFIGLASQRLALVGIGTIKRDNFVDNSDQDSIQYEVQSINRYYAEFLPDSGYLAGRYRFRFNDTDSRSVFQYYSHLVGFTANVPVNWKDVYVEPGGRLEYRRYDEPDPDTRRDYTGELFLRIGKSWTDDLRTELSWRGSRTESSVGRFDETQHVFGLSVTLTF